MLLSKGSTEDPKTPVLAKKARDSSTAHSLGTHPSPAARHPAFYSPDKCVYNPVPTDKRQSEARFFEEHVVLFKRF